MCIKKSRMPPQLQHGFIVTPDKYDITLGAWHWFKVQEVGGNTQLIVTSSSCIGIFGVVFRTIWESCKQV